MDGCAATPHRALPAYGAGQRIGLLGGSFNPPHEAHRAISLFALKRLQLDRIWWLVSPGNPLKDVSRLQDAAARADAARRLANHPRITVSCLEAVIGTRYTIDTVSYLRQHCCSVRFVWIMGADNLMQFHRWDNWHGIAAQVPLAVIDRPPDSVRALVAPAARILAPYRLRDKDAASLPEREPPAWVFLTGLKSTLSSTRLRNPDGSWKTSMAPATPLDD